MATAWTPPRTHLDKPAYPASDLTKADVIAYYEALAPAILPRLAGRPATFKRCPDGVAGDCFIIKNSPRGTPGQVRTVSLPSPGSTKGRENVEYVVIDDVETLLWAANSMSLEIHVPQWQVGPRGGKREPDLLVFDLDPGPPAGLKDCARVALMLRELLDDDGLTLWPKVSGSKGVHLYVPIDAASGKRAEPYARRLAAKLAAEDPSLIVDRMARDERPGKVFIDWNQNNAGKTTIAPYSLRARSRPTVAAPVTWDEVEHCDDDEDLTFELAEVLNRWAKFGDLFADLDAHRQRLPM